MPLRNYLVWSRWTSSWHHFAYEQKNRCKAMVQASLECEFWQRGSGYPASRSSKVRAGVLIASVESSSEWLVCILRPAIKGNPPSLLITLWGAACTPNLTPICTPPEFGQVTGIQVWFWSEMVLLALLAAFHTLICLRSEPWRSREREARRAASVPPM